MTNMYNNSGFNPAFLSQNQQDLLMAALQSNQPETSGAQSNQNNFDLTSASLDPSMLSVSQPEELYNDFDFGAFNDQGVLDLLDSANQADVDFDFDQNDEPSPENDAAMTNTDFGEKRKSMADDKSDNEGGAKRREGEEKQAKKPGRKPLTSEPTSKRKAQNRAAQRAFRERKEKHLRDLETKVSELEKTSESANHENGLLRAQVERLQMELREYRKRLSSQSNIGRSPPSATLGSFSSSGSTPLNPFSFDFPRFQSVPYGPLFGSNAVQASPQSTTMDFNLNHGTVSRHTSTDGTSPGNNQVNTPATTDGTRSQHGSVSQDSSSVNAGSPFGENMFKARNSSLAGLGPGTSPEYNIFTSPTTTEPNSMMQNSETSNPQARQFVFNPTSSSSPSASSSSQSNNGASSSCGTSPEPTTGVNKESTLDTIEESNPQKSDFVVQLSQACGNCENPEPLVKTTPNTTSSFDFTGSLTANSNPFPIFGEHDLSSWTEFPESNTAIMADGAFTGGFMNDSGADLFNMSSPIPMNWNDLTGSMRTGLTPAAQKSNPFDSMRPMPKIKDDEVVPGDGQMLNCNKIWDKIQQRPDFKDLDIDSLCTELRKKAKCSESGVVIDQHDVDAALQRLPSPSSS